MEYRLAPAEVDSKSDIDTPSKQAIVNPAGQIQAINLWLVLADA
jgi:hypothetical protein